MRDGGLGRGGVKETAGLLSNRYKVSLEDTFTKRRGRWRNKIPLGKKEGD